MTFYVLSMGATSMNQGFRVYEVRTAASTPPIGSTRRSRRAFFFHPTLLLHLFGACESYP